MGDTILQYLLSEKAEDRAEAVAFLERSDVVVRNWYKTRGGASEAHPKVWVAHDVPHPAVLSGSANLTHQGLYRNPEIVAEIAAGEVDEAVERVEGLFAKAWDVKDRLLGYITPTDGSSSQTSERITPPAIDNDVDLVIPKWEPRRPPFLWWPGFVSWRVIGTPSSEPSSSRSSPCRSEPTPKPPKQTSDTYAPEAGNTKSTSSSNEATTE